MCPVGGIHGHRDGPADQRSVQIRAASHVNVALDPECRGECFAGAVLGNIGVVRFQGNAVVLDVLVARVHPPPTAAHVAVAARAVDQLLFGVGLLLAAFDHVESLEGAGSGKGPASTAAALVLDFGQHSLGGPVDIGIVLEFIMNSEQGVLLFVVTQVDRHELLGGQG